MDYQKLGLKIGLEIHQQLDTDKLFCDCPSIQQEGEPDQIIERRLHAVAGELGEIDPAAKQAAQAGRTYKYHSFKESSCLVDLDEEPPHKMNESALDIALTVGKLLNVTFVDELHVMRKTVIDGSNTSGFQRTTLVSTDGTLEIDDIKVGIPTICLEEDSCKIIERKEKEVTYNLDRLGTPLVEITTTPDIPTPEDAKKVARALGDILRATKRVKRGLGTIRQDLNVSIKGGHRIEMKGVQDLRILPKAVIQEITRQQTLIEIKEELAKRGVKKIEPEIVDVSKLLEKSESKVIQGALKKKGVVLAAKLDNFKGLLGKEVQPGRRLGSEMSDYAKAYGAKGLFHSDELPAYGVSEKDVEAISKAVKLGKNDAFILIAESEDTAQKAMEGAINRANIALKGVPGETRKSLPDGNSSYLRPLPGAARMYPETDHPPIIINQKHLKKIEEQLPDLPWVQIENLAKKFQLSHDLAEDLYRSSYFEYFEQLRDEFKKLDPKLLANTFTSYVKAAKTAETEVELGLDHYRALFTGLEKNQYSKEAIPKILEEWFKKPDLALDKVVEKLGIKSIDTGDLESVIDKIIENNKKMIEERGDRALQPLMGEVMKEVRGKADGKTIMELLRKKLSA